MAFQTDIAQCSRPSQVIFILLAVVGLLFSACASAPYSLPDNEYVGATTAEVVAFFGADETIVVWWDVACPFCKKLLAELNELYGPGFPEVIGLNVGDDEALIRQTVEERGYRFPVVGGWPRDGLPALGVPYVELYVSATLVARRMGYVPVAELLELMRGEP